LFAAIGRQRRRRTLLEYRRRDAHREFARRQDTIIRRAAAAAGTQNVRVANSPYTNWVKDKRWLAKHAHQLYPLPVFSSKNVDGQRKPRAFVATGSVRWVPELDAQLAIGTTPAPPPVRRTQLNATDESLAILENDATTMETLETLVRIHAVPIDRTADAPAPAVGTKFALRDIIALYAYHNNFCTSTNSPIRFYAGDRFGVVRALSKRLGMPRRSRKAFSLKRSSPLYHLGVRLVAKRKAHQLTVETVIDADYPVLHK